MADQTAKGDDMEKRAEKKLGGWGIFGSKYEDAADLYEKAANHYKLGKNWDKAGAVYIKLANCHLKLESKHEAASAYVDAANCYKKISIQGTLVFESRTLGILPQGLVNDDHIFKVYRPKQRMSLYC